MKKRLCSMLLCGLLLCLIFTACGAKDSETSTAAVSEEGAAYVAEDSGFANQEASAVADAAGGEVADGGFLPSETNPVGQQEGRKIIERLTIYAQTKEFDSLLEEIEQQISACGGYVESSSIFGDDYHSSRSREASYVIRIPAEQSGAFADYLSSRCTVTQKEVSTEDVTLNYIDTESRISALQSEKESLEALMKEAANLENVIQIQERLTEVIYEIESYQSQLRSYDNLIDYTTVSLYLSEVERTAVVEEQSIWQEIGQNISNNFEDIGYFLRGLFVGIASGLPYFLILAVIALVILVIVWLFRRHRRKHPRISPSGPEQYRQSAALPPDQQKTE